MFRVLITLSLVLALLEWGSGRWLAHQSQSEILSRRVIYHDSPEPLLVPDPVLGYRPRRNGSATVIAINRQTNQVVNATLYSTDLEHRRTHTAARAIGVQRAVTIFLGCSYTFGTGVADGETLPAQVQSLLPHMAALNYGVPGYGPGHALILTSEKLNYTDLPLPVAGGVYTLMDDHFRRALPTFKSYQNRWEQLMDSPHFVSEGESALHRDPKLMLSTGSGLPGLFHWLVPFALFRALPFDFPSAHSDYASQKVIQILSEMASAFKKQFPQATFYVLIFPQSHHASDVLAHSHLGEEVTLLDYSKMWPDNSGEYWLPFLDHPSAAAYEAVAKALAPRLSQPVSLWAKSKR